MGRDADERIEATLSGERVLPIIERARKGVGQYWNL
jgi:hypothetical protein